MSGKENNSNNNNSNNLYNAIDAKNNIKVTNSAFYNESLLAIVKNNNNYDLSNVTYKVNFFDITNKLLGTDEAISIILDANQELPIWFFNIPNNVDHYSFETIVEAKNDSYKSYIADLSFKDVIKNNEDESIDFSIYNNSSTVIETITLSVVYYDNNKIVGYDFYFLDNLKEKQSFKTTFSYPFDENDDVMPFTDYKLYINEAYSPVID